jgi:catechol 2,3-dioxygenase-like lactoylglutathione lyase family enzyme
MGHLEHVNMTVADPKATAAMLSDLFGWHVRWEGPAMETGYTVHVGTDDAYVAAYSPGTPNDPDGSSYGVKGGLNHIGIVVDDLDAVRRRVVARGYRPGETYDYAPGRRFYFREENGIEIEVVSYT